MAGEAEEMAGNYRSLAVISSFAFVYLGKFKF